MSTTQIPARPDEAKPKSKSKLAKIALWAVAGLLALTVAMSVASGSEPDIEAKLDAPAQQEDPTGHLADGEAFPSGPESDAATEPVEPVESTYTVSQENAIESAESYLDYGAFSEQGLIDQLSSKYGEGFPKADAIFAVNHIQVDWNEQAAKSAREYLDYSSFSRQGLIDQLESPYGEQFTHAQAVYGVNQTGL
jgi:hypothetical protein